MENKVCDTQAKICKVGGQAVMEGVMMKSKNGVAMAVRTSDGTIVTDYKETVTKHKKGSFPTWPIVRGAFAFVDSLVTGMGTIMRSAELYGEDLEDEEPSKFEKFLSEKLGKSLESIIIGLAVVLGVALSVGLFIVLPVVIGNLIFGNQEVIWRSLLEGGIRLVIFVGYLFFCASLKDTRRIFMYHGAEHKTISCYEAGDKLTPENAMKHKRLHPRCGTNYLFLVMAISILFFTAFDLIIPFEPVSKILRMLYRIGIRLVMLPLVAGFSYEVLQLAAKSDNILAKIVRAPGMALQFITTKEPTRDMIEVAITSFLLAMSSIDETVTNVEAPPSMTFADYTKKKENAAVEASESDSAANNDNDNITACDTSDGTASGSEISSTDNNADDTI